MEIRSGQTPAPADVTTAFDIVILVTSGGGVDAISRVLTDLPAHLPVPVVVMQHLSGHGDDNGHGLVEILRGRTTLPVNWIGDGERLDRGHVQVCPPGKGLEILPDRTCALGKGRTLTRDFVFDELLQSAVDSFGARVLAVVLTGMGRDGARGALAVKRAGGTVIVQSEDTAEYPAMPRAAIAAGAADFVVPLDEIGKVVADVLSGRPLPRSNEELDAVRAVFGNDGEVAKLACEIDWSRTPLGPVQAWSDALRTTARLMMESAHPAMLYWGRDYVLLLNNAALPFNARVADTMARPVLESFPETTDDVRPQLAKVMDGEPDYQLAVRVTRFVQGRTEDGWFDLSYAPVREDDGSVAGVYLMFLDRTREVLAGRRLQTLNSLSMVPSGCGRREALERTLRVLAESADVPFAAAYLLDASASRAGLVSAVGVEEGGRMAPREMRLAPGSGWPVQQVVEARRPVLLNDLGSRFRGHVVGGEQLTPEFAVLHPLRDEHGMVVGVLVLGAHPRLALENRHRAFLTLAGETINAKVAESHGRQQERERLDRLADLERAKTEFFSNVGHEFRTPLTLMLAPLETIQSLGTERPNHLDKDVEVAAASAGRFLTLVNTLLDVSHVEAGRVRAQFEATDLAGLTSDIAAGFRRAAERADLRFVVDCPPLDERVWVDRSMWEKILSNLLANALKFTLTGEISVRLRALPAHAELVVSDTGVGIAEDEQAQIFKRRHRARASRTRAHDGSTDGLALVRELVRLHHGRVRVRSEEGRGSALTVWIPLGTRLVEESPPPPVPAGAADDPLELPSRALMVHAPGARVLVIDDNPDGRDYLRRLLAPCWQVDVAADGEQAVAMARERKPDLVLADVMMPGVDGFALLKRMRDEDALAAIPVVLVTAQGGEERAIAGLLAGADDYIVKPFSARELVARVGGQLEVSRRRRENEARFAASVAGMRRVQGADSVERHRAERWLGRVLETDAVGLLYFDQQGMVIEANDVFLRMTGYTRDQIGRRELTWRMMTPPEWVAASHAQLGQLARTGRLGPYEKEYFLADRTRRRMLIVGRDLGDGTVGEYCIDITEINRPQA